MEQRADKKNQPLLPTEEERRRKRKSLVESINPKEKTREAREARTKTGKLTASKNRKMTKKEGSL